MSSDLKPIDVYVHGRGPNPKKVIIVLEELSIPYNAIQMSGQGPYFGQGVWFHIFHPEDVPSAKERYKEQVVRVVQVLDKILEGKEYLVGDKCTYADIAFIPWNTLIPVVGDTWEKYKIDENYKNYYAWHQRVLARPSVKKGLLDIE